MTQQRPKPTVGAPGHDQPPRLSLSSDGTVANPGREGMQRQGRSGQETQCSPEARSWFHLWTYSFRGQKPAVPLLPSKATTLFFSTSPKTLSLRFNLIPVHRGWFQQSQLTVISDRLTEHILTLKWVCMKEPEKLPKISYKMLQKQTEFYQNDGFPYSQIRYKL